MVRSQVGKMGRGEMKCGEIKGDLRSRIELGWDVIAVNGSSIDLIKAGSNGANS